MSLYPKGSHAEAPSWPRLEVTVCPPAGASQEANGADSLAAPAPGQRAGIPPAVFVVSWMERSLRRRASDWKERIVMFDNYDSAVRAAQAAKARGWCPGIVRRMAR